MASRLLDYSAVFPCKAPVGLINSSGLIASPERLPQSREELWQCALVGSAHLRAPAPSLVDKASLLAMFTTSEVWGLLLQPLMGLPAAARLVRLLCAFLATRLLSPYSDRGMEREREARRVN